MRKFLLSAISLSLLFALPSVALAKQSCDFSDISEPFMTWPFNVINVDVTGEYDSTHHVYHVAASVDQVIAKLTSVYEKKQSVGKYYIMGITPQLEQNVYQLVIGYQNEHHYARIAPDGSNTIIDFEAMPSSYVTGVYPIAAYGFVMPDGATVSLDQMTEE